MGSITDVNMFQRRPSRMTRALLVATSLAIVLLLSACAQGPNFVPPDQRHAIDRKYVEYPGGVVLKEAVRNLTGPVDCEVDAQGNLIVAESGTGGVDPRLYGFKKDGTFFSVYPPARSIDLGPLNVVKSGFKMYGPIGGIALDNGKIYVSHRDRDGFGVITAFNYDGTH